MLLTKKHKAIAEILVVIVNRGKGKKVIDLLQKEDVDMQLLSMGSGTASSTMAELFNLDNLEKEIIFSLIKLDNEKSILDGLKELFLDGKTTGIAFTTPIKSATSDLIERLGYKI